MKPARSAETLFHEALEQTPAERAGFLARACAGDATLRREVESLIEAHDRAPSCLDLPGFLLVPRPEPPGAVLAEGSGPSLGAGHPAEQPPAGDSDAVAGVIGRYRLMKRIGQGGFGTVYLAEQQEPFRRKVALKMIRLGLDTRQFLARFEAERQALAMMDHPCIARVLDAGATENSRPYFVMELVQGVSITSYCDQQQLPVEQRVELFIQVCQAVQHAHQKGIIHRDLKPSNILVTIQEGGPLPKVIDFGVAKAVQQPLTDKTMFTAVGQFIGTPNYMSPEQADVGVLDVDTRSDIYSLGAVLYELLTGVTPFAFGEMAEPRMNEILRMIVEDDAPRPSQRFSGTGQARTDIARGRATDPSTLARALCGELDWIVMKALEKDRTRRYETAAALAADLRRYLDDEPVSASPPSALYRLRKLMKRHRAAVSFGLVLLLGLAGTAGGLVWAAGQRARAALAEAAHAKAAGALADQRARELETVVEFQRSILNGIDSAATGQAFFDELRGQARRWLQDQGPDADPDAALAGLETILAGVNSTDLAVAVINSQILEKAEAAIDQGFRDRPLIQAALQQHLSEVYSRRQLYDAAERLQDSAYNLRLAELGPADPETLDALSGRAIVASERGDYAVAERLHREAMEGFRRLGIEDDPRAVAARSQMALTLHAQGQYAESEELLRDVYRRRVEVEGADSRAALATLSNLGSVLQAQGKMEEAARTHAEVLAAYERTAGPEDPATLTALHNQGMILQAMGQHDQAVPLYRRRLDACTRIYGASHGDTLVTANNLAAALRELGQLEEAEKYFRMALEGERQVLGADHPEVFVTMNNLASLLQSQSRFAEVEELLREALSGLEQSVGADHPDAIVIRSNLAAVLIKLERAQEAEGLAADAFERARRTLGAEHWICGVALSKHGLALQTLGQYADAERDLLRSHTLLAAALGPDHQHTQRVGSALDQLYQAWHVLEPSAGHDQKVGRWRGDAAVGDSE
jgi:non-specific serine/threonine protein kinase/serine/threonine-protein kinase